MGNGPDDGGVREEGGGVHIEFRTPGSGRTTAYLARAKGDVPVVPRLAEDTEPRFDGTIDQFREGVKDEKARARLLNKVKVCAQCKKPCAFTLQCCNACGSSLADVPVSFNDNIFMGFVHGIKMGKFPFKISKTHQDASFLCFDDPLSMSCCHLNVVPTDVYIADWRFLLLNPAKGLKLVTDMFETGAKVALDQFWGNDEFRSKIFNGEQKPLSTKEIMDVTCCGMNFPPSMYQLHLQFIHMPLTPFHYNQARQGGHWHYARFFPLEYVMKALELGSKAEMNVTESTSIEDIMQKLQEHGVVYDSVHREFLNKCWRLQERFAPWAEKDFGCQIINGSVFNMAENRMELDSDPQSIQAEDAKKLQNYGRPYDDAGKPTGTYYKYAKEPGDVADFR
ncbi:unnamed protein product [Prorocentrum cordatum]|uniref:Uncharacterized protein n=1 Tax=Prorocentrum cordatum TaxID=2364126 RepID=A0ABN9XL36_9DINO|nr:unnamed protein product [Polarella glacialis]